MNKKIFNWKQFVQSFWQLKTVGIVFTLLFAFVTFITPVSGMLNLKESIEIYGNTITFPYVVNITSELGLFVLTFVIYTPLITLMCWNFMTKRNASDFYQSLPYTRVCTYLTHAAAVIAWLLITIALSGAVGAVTYSVLSDYFIVDFGTMIHTLFSFFVCNLLCMAAITLACTITGNLFSNVIVSGLIIFLPRIMAMVVSNVMADILPVLSSDKMFAFFGTGHNMLLDLVFDILGIANGNVSTLLLSYHGLVYTLVLALIYLILAGLMFCIRKSETAGKGACSRIVQATIRVIIGFVICFFVVLSVLSTYINGRISADMVISVIICFIIAAGAMMLYEAINVKSVKGAIKSIPSVLIAYVLSIVAGLGVYGILCQIEKFTPTADRITSITMKEKKDWYSYSAYESYFTDYISEIKIDSDEVEKIFCDVLKDNIENIGLNGSVEEPYRYTGRRTCYTVGFNSGNKTTYRNVFLTNEQITEVTTKLQSVESFKNAMLDLPKAKDASVEINSGVQFTKKQIDELYECMLSESKEIAFSDWYALTQTMDLYSVSITFSRDGRVYSAVINIDERLPKTFAKYIEFTNSYAYESSIIDNMVKYLNGYIDGKNYTQDDFYLSMRILGPDAEAQEYYSIYDYVNMGAYAKEILKNAVNTISQKDADKNIDISKKYIKFSYSEYTQKDYFDEQYIEVFVPVVE